MNPNDIEVIDYEIVVVKQKAPNLIDAFAPNHNKKQLNQSMLFCLQSY